MKTTSLGAAVVLAGASIALAACGSAGGASSAPTATATTTGTDTVTTTTTAGTGTDAGTTKAMTPAGDSWCTAKDLDIKVAKGHSPTAANRLFVIPARVGRQGRSGLRGRWYGFHPTKATRAAERVRDSRRPW